MSSPQIEPSTPKDRTRPAPPAAARGSEDRSRAGVLLGACGPQDPCGTPSISGTDAAGPGGAWYAVHTRSNFEKRVAADLGLKQIEAYLPVFEAMHRWKDRNKLVQTPVFSCYVFVRFLDCDSARLRVLRTPGVVRILGTEGRLEPIPESQLEAVRRMVQEGRSCSIHPLLREGTRVRVLRGPLKDIEGFFVRAKSCCRLVVSLPLLSQSIASEVDAADIEPLPHPAGPPRASNGAGRAAP